MTIVAMETKAEPARPLIHTREAGDQYYIGNCYERSSMPSEWETDSREMPYLSHVKHLSSSWKPLRFLADFMEVGTTPLRWKYVKNSPGEREERVRRTNVTYLKCSPSKTTLTRRLYDADTLKELVSTLSKARADDDSTHVFLVEDLSRDVIEALGAAFDIDPFFFREQIDEYIWYNTRDPWAKPSHLMAAMDNADWFRIRNVRLHYFETRELFDQARQESNFFNVLRRPDCDDNHWKFLDKPGAIVSLTRTKTSIWTGKTGSDNNITVGIVLVNPTVSMGCPLWHGQTNWLPRPSIHLSKDATKPTCTSLYVMIAEKTTSYPWFSRSPQNPAASRLLSSTPVAQPRRDDEFEDIAQDFRRVQRNPNELQARVDRLTAIVTSEMSIEDARRGLGENRNLARLTWIATTFIPLSFVTGLFSMQPDLAELRATLGWYFAAALPLASLVMVASRKAGGGTLHGKRFSLDLRWCK